MKMLSVYPLIVKRVYASIQRRFITALYVTGDKATENYAPLQPYLDFADAVRKTTTIQSSISHRKLKLDINEFLRRYNEYVSENERIKAVNLERENIAKQLKDSKNMSKVDIDRLKTKGKELRNKVKAMKENFYPIEDNFIHMYLTLPNELHLRCPVDLKEKIIYRSANAPTEGAECHTSRTDLIRFIDLNRYYLNGDAAEFDLHYTQSVLRYIHDNSKFIQTANPDFVRAVLLEANATPLSNYHLVKEEQLINKINCAYLTGGGAFESFLGAVSKLCVYPSILPMRLVSSGRSYLKASQLELNRFGTNLFTATQSNCIQTFVATEEATEAEEEMETILNLMVNVYKQLQIPFRIVYADASSLLLSESLRAVIEFYSPSRMQYIPVGHISHYTDYVSKRILFASRQDKDYKFVHLVGGPVLLTSRLIGTMIENGISLKHRDNWIGANNSKPPNNSIEEFKSIFQ